MTDFEIKKCIELGRKWPDIDPGEIIKGIRLEYGIYETLEKPITKLELIAKIVCDYLNENINELLRPKGNESGRRQLSIIRQMISLIAYNYGYTFEKIGKYLIRDHSTIVVSYKKAKGFYNIERKFREDVDTCRNLIEKEIKQSK